MNPCKCRIITILVGVLAGTITGTASDIVFETTSAYHHIKVIDLGDIRTLHFNRSIQSQMSLKNPLEGHLEYVEYFHMPWLWNDHIKKILIIGLGGSSIPRAYQYYYPEVASTTVELDPKVLEVAQSYFHFKESERMKVILEDGRVYIRRMQETYDAIFLDAYTDDRYGSYLPYALVTQEFFELANRRLSENGVLLYNVIGDYRRGETIVGALYKTLKTCFPRVYMFPAKTSRNVVMVATRSAEALTRAELQTRMQAFLSTRERPFPNFRQCLRRFYDAPPTGMDQARILTDDFAPVDGLIRVE